MRALARLEGRRARLWPIHPSRLAQRRKCAARLAPQDDGDVLRHHAKTRIRIPAARNARGLQVIFALENKEGAGNAGCALHPRSRVQCAQGVRTRAYRAAESIRHSLRNGFTAYNVLSLVIGFLATIIGGTDRQLDASTGASGPHDFTVRSRAVRYRHYQRPPRPVPRS